jgi:trk system potassium uptake protein TrkA
MSGLYARHMGVRKVIVKNNRDNYMSLLGSIGLDSAVNTKQVTSNIILRTVRTRSAADAAAAVERIYRLIEGKVEALEFIVRDDDDFINIPLKDLTVRDNALVAVIVRNNQVKIPFGSDTLKPLDHVIVMIKGNEVSYLSDVLDKART